jgi:hypothetical protein
VRSATEQYEPEVYKGQGPQANIPAHDNVYLSASNPPRGYAASAESLLSNTEAPREAELASQEA